MSPRTTRLWDRGEVIGAAALAFAGIAWSGWAQDDPPPSRVPFLVAGSVVSAFLLTTLVALLVRRRTTTGSPMADPVVRRGYWITVGIEVVVIVGGNLVLAAVGRPAYGVAWMLLVVGIHFVPLARIFDARGLALTGGVTAVVAVAAACLGLAGDLAPGGAGRRRWRSGVARVCRLGPPAGTPSVRPGPTVTLLHTDRSGLATRLCAPVSPTWREQASEPAAHDEAGTPGDRRRCA